eukprot:8160803-Karenia_brevis.AAC.1
MYPGGRNFDEGSSGERMASRGSGERSYGGMEEQKISGGMERQKMDMDYGGVVAVDPRSGG